MTFDRVLAKKENKKGGERGDINVVGEIPQISGLIKPLWP
jgi:hypothetical protein